MDEKERLLDKQITELKEIKTYIMAGDKILREILFELRDLCNTIKYPKIKNG